MYWWLVLIRTLFTGLCLGGPFVSPDHSPEVEWLYLEKLRACRAAVAELDADIRAGRSEDSLKTRFGQARIAYKGLSVFNDNFNPYETKLLNAPALVRVEEDNPQTLIQPHGFQQLEELLWNGQSIDSNRQHLLFETDYILSVLDKLNNEPDRRLKFRDNRNWDAMYVAVIRVMTLGLSSYDAPNMENAAQESASVLKTIAEWAALYEEDIKTKKALNAAQLASGLTQEISQLAGNPDLQDPDRAQLVREMLNPLSVRIRTAAAELGINPPEGRRPLKSEGYSIFSPGAFDADFFGPGSRYNIDPAKIALGRTLFYDTRLSAGGNRSCATCHKPELAFTD